MLANVGNKPGQQNPIYGPTYSQIKCLITQVILAGALTGVQGDIRYKVLAALSTVK